MWIPRVVLDYLRVSKEGVDTLREELAAARAERDAFRVENAVLKTNFDWLRMKVNQLEYENKALIQKAYDIKLPAPELVRQMPAPQEPIDMFGDVGEEFAKRLGLPAHNIFEQAFEQTS
jgi:hypothetical protein